MKTLSSKDLVRSLVAISLATLGSSAFAAWGLDIVGTCTGNNVYSETCATTGTGAGTATLSGWSTGTGTIAAPTAGTTFAAAKIYNYGANAGVGIVATNEDASVAGPHATDNVNGIDAMLLGFGTNKVNLTSLTIGWNGTDNATGSYTDSDLSVLAWTGGGAPVMLASGLLSSGWTLVGNYADVGSNSGNLQSPITSAIYSSYWLISAYSTAYGSGTNLGQGNDAFKLLSIAGGTCAGTVTGTTCGGGGGGKVPEPGSLALMGAALAGMMVVRRRKEQVE